MAFNLDDTVFVKGTITGVFKRKGNIEYNVAIRDSYYNSDREVQVSGDDMASANNVLTIGELKAMRD